VSFDFFSQPNASIFGYQRRRFVRKIEVRTDWEAKAKGMLKAELKRHGLTYEELAKKLALLGVEENERNISNKVGRGKFSAVFLLQCLEAIGTKTLHL
jgi:hypothetical protein